MGYREVPAATERCPGCAAEVPQGSELCPSCGNPTDAGRLAELELKLKPDLKKARTFLGVLTGLEAVRLAIALATEHSGAAALISSATERSHAITTSAVGVAFFGGCFLAAFRWPLGASITSMAVFLFNVAATVSQGKIGELFHGFVLKVVFLTLLGAGIRSGYRVRDLRGQWKKRDLTIGIAALAGGVALGILFGLWTGAAVPAD
jgi:hypothetical protein